MNHVSPRVSPLAGSAGIGAETRVENDPATFLALYRAHFPFVWRSVRQLGGDVDSVDDVVQEIFVVVHRRYRDFEGRSSARTWLFGIARRIVADHRKSKRRKPATPTEPTILDTASPRAPESERLEAFDLVCTLLDTLDEAKREVFVLAELEGMTMAEIAEATSTNPNTVAARLRAARFVFERALAEHERSDGAPNERRPR